ncbi:DUF2017 family protein [Cellulomonas soli]
MRRLLPDASRDDEDLTAEFRRLTQDDVRAGKVARLATLWRLVTDPGPVPDALVVPAAIAQDVAATLTDVRLVLADRLDVRTDEDADALYDVLDLPPGATTRTTPTTRTTTATRSWPCAGTSCRCTARWACCRSRSSS